MHFCKYILLFFLIISCKDMSKKEKPISKPIKKSIIQKDKEIVKEFKLNDENAIPFLFEYGKKNKENKVRINTGYGSIDIELFNDTPYHRANFIYLIKNKYFQGEYFHRVVKDFIIQGGNSDNISTSKKRRKIGRYLLPPDTKKGYKHHRGILSMPSSEIENPYKLASPYEFFIVQKKDGAYHLDKNYTAFGKVIKGMNVVDLISNLETDKREWPLDNVRFNIEIIE
ncbi:MAG: peptidylprolyl isomerase [Flavobacteriales bacterium]|nr:MAG: peptidylprolyl isomerase [Flavobacteriales bacterium]